MCCNMPSVQAPVEEAKKSSARGEGWEVAVMEEGGLPLKYYWQTAGDDTLDAVN